MREPCVRVRTGRRRQSRRGTCGTRTLEDFVDLSWQIRANRSRVELCSDLRLDVGDPTHADRTLDRALLLYGVAELTPAEAAALAASTAQTLYLPDVTALHAETAAALAPWGGSTLYLDGLTALTHEVVQALGPWSGVDLFLGGMSALDRATAEASTETPEGQNSGRVGVLDGL